MSLQDQKITESERDQLNVKSVSGSRLEGTVQENKNIFDRFVEFLTNRHNGMIDTLSETGGRSGAEEIGSAEIAGLNDPANPSEPADTVWRQIKALFLMVTGHMSRVDNPHDVTKAQVGLSNVDNTADLNKPISTAQQAALDLKLNANLAVDFIKDVHFDSNTGVFTFYQHDDTSFAVDTVLEKVPISCQLDGTDFILTLEDGTEQRVSLAAFVDVYGFVSTPTVKFTKAADSNTYTAEIPDGAVGREKLAPAVMEELIGLEQSARTEEGKAETKATEAAGSAQVAGEKATEATDSAHSAETRAREALTHATEAKSWAVGRTTSRDGEDADNAKYYAEQARSEADRATTNIAVITLPAGRMAGDVDGDGVVTQADRLAIGSIVSGKNPSPEKDSIDFLAMDTNRDGVINGLDGNVINRFLTGDYSSSYIKDVTGAWTTREDLDGTDAAYFFYVDVPMEGITAASTAKIYLTAGADRDVKVVAAAGMYPHGECRNGSLRIYSKFLPVSPVKAVVEYSTSGDGSALIVNASFIHDAEDVGALPIAGGSIYGDLNLVSGDLDLVDGKLILDRTEEDVLGPTCLHQRNLDFNEVFRFNGDTLNGTLPKIMMRGCELDLTGGKLKIDSPAGAMSSSIVIPSGRMMGDANGDGMITTADSEIILSTISGHVPRPESGTLDFLAMDTNQTGTINALDTNAVIGFIAGQYISSRIKDVSGNWTTREDLDDIPDDEVRYLFYVDIPVEGMTAKSSAKVYLTLDSSEEHKSVHICGIYPHVECLNGAIRIYTMLLPIVPIHADIEFFSGNGDGIVVNSGIFSKAEDIGALPVNGGKMNGDIDLNGKKLILEHTSNDQYDVPTFIQKDTIRYADKFVFDGVPYDDGTVPPLYIRKSNVILLGGTLKANTIEGATMASTTMVSDSLQIAAGATEKNVEAAMAAICARLSALEAGLPTA